MGVTIWIVPPKPIREALEKRIMTIRPPSKRPLNPSTYPHFTPHITLAALGPNTSIPLERLRTAIPKDTPPTRATFASIEVGDHFFRSVYTAIKSTAELLELHKRVHDALDLPPRTPKYPHVSLAYIVDEDAEEREAYLQALKDEGVIREEGDRVGIQCGEDGGWVDGFDVKEIWIAKCDGPVESWEILDRLTL
ncbi:LigT-like protein [Schizophyllum commune H4-8]|nr:LigT-like protein [Schizophyllum commune H4-8]KAI5900473.1 LigT-like protein [Schizophyllum commune H4-8]